jgi:hypothetical protein
LKARLHLLIYLTFPRETIDHIDMTLGAIVLDWEDETKVLTNTERSNYIKSKVVHMTEVLQNEMIISHKVHPGTTSAILPRNINDASVLHNTILYRIVDFDVLRS